MAESSDCLLCNTAQSVDYHWSHKWSPLAILLPYLALPNAVLSNYYWEYEQSNLVRSIRCVNVQSVFSPPALRPLV